MTIVGHLSDAPWWPVQIKLSSDVPQPLDQAINLGQNPLYGLLGYSQFALIESKPWDPEWHTKLILTREYEKNSPNY